MTLIKKPITIDGILNFYYKQDYYVIVFKKKCVDTFYSYFESLTIFKKSSKKPTVEKNRFTPYK